MGSGKEREALARKEFALSGTCEEDLILTFHFSTNSSQTDDVALSPVTGLHAPSPFQVTASPHSGNSLQRRLSMLSMAGTEADEGFWSNILAEVEKRTMSVEEWIGCLQVAAPIPTAPPVATA